MVIRLRDGPLRAEVPSQTGRGWVPLVRAVGGPIVIVVAVLVVLRDIAFGGMVSDQHIDLLSFWLPTHCFLGSTLAAGTIPLWNPHVMAGVPFAADPQSGWMALSAMGVYSLLPCGAAVGVLLVGQPILGGLGIYWFLRGELLSRLAATIGGLAMALGIAGARMVLSVPISGSLAWTAIVLALASAFLRAPSWPARIGWGVAVAVAWGQLAAAHLSHGLVMGTVLLVAYVLIRSGADVRAGVRTWSDASAAAAVLLALLVPVNLAYLLPRIAYLPQASIGLGYEGLEQLAADLSGEATVTVAAPSGVGPAWPAALAMSPGAYLGAVVLLLSLGGWWSPSYRPLVLAFTVVGAAFYLLSLDVVARTTAPLVRALPLGEFYLEYPPRFRWGLMVVIPVLGAVGLESWRTAGRWAPRLAMLAAGGLVWGTFVVAAPGDGGRLLLPGLGAVASLAVLVAMARRPSMAVFLPCLLAVELAVSGLLGQALRGSDEEAGASGSPFTMLLRPNVPVHAYLEEGRIARTIREAPVRARFMTLRGASGQGRDRGYHSFWSPEDRGLLNKQRAMLFGLEDAQGYNPVQLRPYWMFLRHQRPPRMGHNRAVLPRPSPTQLDLLHVGWINGPIDIPPREKATFVAREGAWGIHRRPVPPRATVVTEWVVEPDDLRALELIAEDGFDPSRLVVLDRSPAIDVVRVGADPGAARYEQVGPGEAKVTVEAPAGAVLLVRNSYHGGWRATVDERPTEVLRGNAFLQAVAVPPGASEVRLWYEDPTVGRGLAGSGAALLLLAGIAAVVGLRDRRRASGPRREDGDTLGTSPG